MDDAIDDGDEVAMHVNEQTPGRKLVGAEAHAPFHGSMLPPERLQIATIDLIVASIGWITAVSGSPDPT